MPDLINLTDFTDYLLGFNRESGTANENRAFVFNTITEGITAGFNNSELYSSYTAAGITIPFGVFTNIATDRAEFKGEGNIIQFLSPLSPIPSFDLPEYKYDISVNDVFYDFITYADIQYQSTITGDIITKTDSYLAYDDVFTPSELKSTIASAFATAYQARVISVTLRRSYQSLT